MSREPVGVPLLSTLREGARGVIGALARDGDRVFAITARHLLDTTAHVASAERALRGSSELVGMVAIDQGLRPRGKVAYPWLPVDADRLLGAGVYRLRAGDLEPPGQITG